MPLTTRLPLACIAAAFALGLAATAQDLPGTGQDAGQTVIYRDTWGVPHIYAPTVEDGLYAMGWAQAEDRPEQLLRNFMQAMGETASIDGPSGLEADIAVRMLDHYGTARRKYDRVDAETRSHFAAFVQGINDYYAANPKDRPEWWGDRRVDEAMVIAFGRLFLYNWSVDQALDDLRRAGIEPGFPEDDRWSNQWAVSPQRSAENAAILLIDPHLSWFGPSRFWEFRIHAGDIHGSGFTLPGVPYIGLGHNENVAWAMTTGGPDTADVYELTLNPENPHQYRYDDEWRDLESRVEVFKVPGGQSITRRVWTSHYGPVVAVKDDKAYAVKTAYQDVVEPNRAWLLFNRARDYRDIQEGLATQTVFPQNIMVADTSGNIYYQRTGRVPRRPEGYDWSRPVDGSTSKTEWIGLHPPEDLLQVLNPPQGYMQNCNIPPDAMMVGSPFRLDKTLPYLFDDAPYGPNRSGWTNQRGARAVQLLHNDDSVTAEEARDYANDIQPYGVRQWIDVLRTAHEHFGDAHAGDADYEAAIEDLLAWDLKLHKDSTAALKYYYWRRQLVDDYGRERASEMRRAGDYYASLGKEPPALDLSDDEYEAALASLPGAMAALRNDFGSLDATYGQKFRVGRDGQSWPLDGGGDGALGMQTLRSLGFSEERDDHTRWGRGGQTSTQIVVLSKPIRSWTYVPIGQSDRPDSPHYVDQARELFSPREMKPTWWRPEELVDHIESRTILERGSKTEKLDEAA